MKLKELIEKLDDTEVLFINGKHYDGNIPEKMIEMEITKINIETKNISGDDLDSLGYSFEVGVWFKCIWNLKG